MAEAQALKTWELILWGCIEQYVDQGGFAGWTALDHVSNRGADLDENGGMQSAEKPNCYD
jgi:hypothetical protein